MHYMNAMKFIRYCASLLYGGPITESTYFMGTPTCALIFISSTAYQQLLKKIGNDFISSDVHE